jgi:hypothetical protein
VAAVRSTAVPRVSAVPVERVVRVALAGVVVVAAVRSTAVPRVSAVPVARVSAG